MMKPSHFRTPREMHETVFYDTRYRHINQRIEAGLDVLTAVGLGLAGAVFFFFWLSH